MSRLRSLFIIAALLIASCLLLSQYKTTDIKPLDRRRSTKNILYWTPMFQRLDFYLGLGSQIFKDCTYDNCYATYNKNFVAIDQFDAIIFHGIEYREETYGKPEKRDPRQIYVFSNQESPVYTPNFIKDYNNFYNWTMTHRLDSDIVRPYGFFEKKKTDYRPPTPEEIQKRPKMIAWFVSNCGTVSQREMIYKKLADFVEIDVYGICGTLQCPKRMGDKCYSLMEKNYKFYLSFENSICEDYVTEKLYNVLKRNIVPIVYGGANYTKIAPPNSVINVMDFESVDSLVQYIRHLDANPEKYLKYFEWKKDYVVDTRNRFVLCNLCRKLNEPIRPKVYGDIEEWWAGKEMDKCPQTFNKFLN